jgi:hypothetical protein
MKKIWILPLGIVGFIASVIFLELRSLHSIPEAVEITYPTGSSCIENGVVPKATVYGDFDGDGREDHASLIQKSSTENALRVWLSSENLPRDLDVSNDLATMMITIAKSGETIQSACARGEEDLCSDDEAREVKLQSDAIWYTQCGAAASVFYWNRDKKTFDRIWFSD